MFRTWFWSAAAILVVISTGVARPPPNPDASLHTWFESLIDPDTMLPCCGEADCRIVDARVTVDHHEALVRGVWLSVPEDKIVHRADNPTGQAILCWSPSFGILCFVPGPGA